MTIRTGILGGTFDPIHHGHLKCALFVKANLQLDKLVFVPSATPPHKSTPQAKFKHRFEMIRLAIQAYTGVYVSDIEAQLPKPSYSCNTMEYYKSANPLEETFFIIGEDNLNNIHSWKNSQEFIHDNQFILMRRGGINPSRRTPPHLTEEQYNKLTTTPLFPPPVELSSTFIREKLSQSLDLENTNWFPKKVAKYIMKHQLYLQTT